MKWSIREHLILTLISLFLLGLQLETEKPQVEKDIFETGQTNWVNSVFSQMDLSEKIGQLFMVTTYSNLGDSHTLQIEKYIKENKIGGLIFMQGGPARQVNLVNRYQVLSEIPLLIAQDAEYGLAMRLDSTMRFPNQLTLGAIDDERYVYDMGSEIAHQLKAVGVNVNFAPVVDVNVNPANPVIGWRSFGENPENVTRKAKAYMKGLQQNQVIANAKHFPGHGDTNTDSHYDLPAILHKRERLDSVEIEPFKNLIADSLQSVMIAHLNVPSLDSTPNLPTSLSKPVVTDLLREEIGFQGLVFTDALNMKGVTKYYDTGEVEVKALLAGVDILLSPENVPLAIKKIKEAVEAGKLSEEEIDKKVIKILQAKYIVGLNLFKPLPTDSLKNELFRSKALAIKSELYEQAITIVKNREGLLPFVSVDSIKYASVSIGATRETTFQKYLEKYAPFTHFNVASRPTASQAAQVLKAATDKNIVVVGIHGMNNRRSKRYNLTSEAVSFINKLRQKTKVIVVVFGNPYSLKYLPAQDWLVCAYENDTLMQKAVPQALFGANSSFGKLPVTISNEMKEGQGFRVNAIGRMGYGFPESVKMNSQMLATIDSLAQESIRKEETPSCQVLVARKGKIIFEKAYGFHTYSKKREVTTETIYDLASLTKVLSTLQATMLLEGKKGIELDAKLVDYLPELEGTDKANMTIFQILGHQAGLIPFYPFWSRIMEEKEHNPSFIANVKSDSFNVQLTDDLYAINAIEDSVYQWLIETDLSRRRGRASKYSYRYSDLGFMFLKKVIESVENKRLDQVVESNFYHPLGLKNLGYHPLERFTKSDITPTEMDIYLRKGLVHGYVHDPGAILQHGVGGHAGLFSNAHDIALLLQMNLQGGFYGGKQFIGQETIEKFNTRYFIKNRNRRALGWDKPGIKNIDGPTSELSSSETFGHQGFTGTCAWVDPQYELVYVFLSNRIHPFAGNRKLIRNDTRQLIQDVIYNAIQDYHEHAPIGRAKK